jgi:outer membrane protein assembly factor BamB
MMVFRKLKRILLAILGFFLLVASAGAQCLERDDFTYCPDTDTMYILTPTSLGAVRVSGRKIKWRIDLPKETLVNSEVAATADIVAFVGNQYPSRIRGYEASNGRLAWSVETPRTTTLASLGPYIFADTSDPEGMITIDAKTGEIVWKGRPGNPDFVKFLDSSDSVLLTNLFAMDARSGRILRRWPKDWRVSSAASSGDLRIIGASYAWPPHVKLAVYSGPVYKMLWTRSDLKEPIVAGIATEGDTMLVATYEEEHMFNPGRAALEMISARTGKTLWTKEITSNYMLLPTPVALTQGTAIFFMDDTPNSGVVEALDADTGIQKWVVHTDRRLIDGVICSAQHCYFESLSHEILEVDARSGAASWFALPKQ